MYIYIYLKTKKKTYIIKINYIIMNDTKMPGLHGEHTNDRNGITVNNTQNWHSEIQKKTIPCGKLMEIPMGNKKMEKLVETCGYRILEVFPNIDMEKKRASQRCCYPYKIILGYLWRLLGPWGIMDKTTKKHCFAQAKSHFGSQKPPLHAQYDSQWIHHSCLTKSHHAHSMHMMNLS